MALRSGLIGNSVIQGLLGGGINNIRNASFQKANAARPQSQAVRLGTKGAIVTKDNTAQGLSMLAKGLSDIANMRKEKAAKDALSSLYRIPEAQAQSMSGPESGVISRQPVAND